MSYMHWKVEIKNNVTWAYFDKADNAVNTINNEALVELEKIIQDTDASNNSTQGLVIASKKTTGFIAGADIEQFTKIHDSERGFELIRYGQKVFSQLESMRKPTLALIQGFCVGGGCELILACRYRIAEESHHTRIGLPEVLLGIHPGWGGTVRLPKLIGGLKAMPIILSGKMVTAKSAKKLGLVDIIVPKRQLESAVNFYMQNRPQKHQANLIARLSNQPFARMLLAKVMRKQLAKKANQAHYPAPYAAIEQWQKQGVADSAYEPEAKSIANLFVTSTAQNLIRVFFLQTQLKAQAKNITHTVKHVHVIGAGTMGGDIAAWCALNNIKTTLQDKEMKFIAPAIARAAKLYQKKLKQPHLIQAALDQLVPDVSGEGAKTADLIIEAIFENTEAKQTLFKALEVTAKPEAIFATNTSSIPLDKINTVLDNPERLVGIHFFNPVAQMQLIEVVRGDKTSPDIVKKAICFVRQVKRLPLPVKSSPGFVINRILLPYLMESVLLIDEGYSKESIDKAAVDFGMPMGPVVLADTVGLDVCLSVAEELIKHFGGEVPQCLQAKVAEKHFGKKAGRGFYDYKNGKLIKAKNSKLVSFNDLEKIQERLIYRMLNEAAACLREGVIESEDLLDAGMIFGTGFAPFTGGPMHFAHTQTKEKIVTVFAELSEAFGDRFKADAYWTAP